MMVGTVSKVAPDAIIKLIMLVLRMGVIFPKPKSTAKTTAIGPATNSIVKNTLTIEWAVSLEITPL